MSFVRKSIDWGIIVATGAIVLVVFYGFFLDVLDGRYVSPILEMGARSSGTFTHETTKKVYHPGEMVYALVRFQKNRNIIGTIQWHLIDGVMITYPSRTGSLPVGIWDKEVPVEVIPDDTKPGERWFCGTVVYHPNWLGMVTYPVWTNKFEVVR